MKFKYNDGGRAETGREGKGGDCVVRAIAIATDKSYDEVFDALLALAQKERITKRRKKKSTVSNGVHRVTYDKYLKSIGWNWVPTMKIGSGCTVHLKASELPKGTIIVRLSRHVACVKDGVINDTYDCSRDETRCVYGYYTQEQVVKVKSENPKLSEIIEEYHIGDNHIKISKAHVRGDHYVYMTSVKVKDTLKHNIPHRELVKAYDDALKWLEKFLGYYK